MSSTISRRRLLKNAAAVGGAALAAPGATAASGLGQVSRPAAPGRKFRGWVSRGSGAGRTTLQELTLRPIGGRQVVVRTEATNLCYSNASDVLGLPGMFGGPMAQMPLIQGHGGVGVVEAVGPEVRRVQVGRPRVRVGHAAVRLLLPVPARPRRHVPVPRTPGPRRSRADRRHARRHAGVRQLAHRRPGRADGDVRGMGRPGVHEGERRRTRDGLQLRRAWPGSAPPRRRRWRRWRPASIVGRGRLRTARAQRRPGRPHRRRVDDHRHRSRCARAATSP